MPVKWTSENDQLLLLKILETHDIHVDSRKISAAWPQDKGDVPTARAITERLVKIRNDSVKKNGGQHFAISSSQVKASRNTSSNPHKSKAASGGLDKPSPIKRKRNNASVDFKAETVESDDEVTITSHISRHEMGQLKHNAPPMLQGHGPTSLTSSFGGVHHCFPSNGVNTPMRNLSVANNFRDDDEEESPIKRARAAAVNSIEYSESDVGADSDVSEFIEDEAV